MRSLLISLMVLGLVGSLAGGGLFAHFTDTEQSTNNTFTAGKLDILLDVNGGTEYNGVPIPLFGANDNLKPCTTVIKTLSVHLSGDSLPATATVTFIKTDDSENSIVEPEVELADDATDGELDEMLMVTMWNDANDNQVQDTGETPIFAGYANAMPASIDLGALVPCQPVYVGISIHFEQGAQGIPANKAMTDSYGFSVKVDAQQQ